ncbi:MAG: cation transporter [Clostridia bacterium]|nr:cation transporter [Clostridia bacterium]
MKNVIQMRNLECAHCASKMEQQIAKLEGVNSVTISFMTQKMTLDCDESKILEIVLQAKRICKKIEPDCTLVI